MRKEGFRESEGKIGMHALHYTVCVHAKLTRFSSRRNFTEFARNCLFFNSNLLSRFFTSSSRRFCDATGTRQSSTHTHTLDVDMKYTHLVRFQRLDLFLQDCQSSFAHNCIANGIMKLNVAKGCVFKHA